MRSALKFSLYLVTRRGALGEREFLNLILAAIEGGVTVVQLREKNTPTQEIISLGKKLLWFLTPLQIPLIINDRVDIALAIKANGVHLGQSDLNIRQARKILGKEVIVGISVESLAQAKIALQEDVDYLAASPLFYTKTKINCTHPWGLHHLRQLCMISRKPVIAIGGINEKNVEQVMACGTAGVAIVSAIFDSSCPRTSAQNLIKRIKGYEF